MIHETYKLNSGYEIPRIGFGTLMLPKESATQIIADAISAGYRHIDTAVAYQNEVNVGEAVRVSGVPREEIFITTKIPPMVKSYEGARETIRQSLDRLQIGYIDMVLIHGPKPVPFEDTPERYFEENLQVWKAMEEAVEEGLVRSIGVSNFDDVDVANIVENGKIVPAANQIRVHIGDVPRKTMDYCQANGILIEAYSPLGQGRISGSEAVKEMAGKYGVSVQQLGIRFDLQLGTLPLPRTTTKAHMINNAEVDFEISEEDMETLLAVTL